MDNHLNKIFGVCVKCITYKSEFYGTFFSYRCRQGTKYFLEKIKKLPLEKILFFLFKFVRSYKRFLILKLYSTGNRYNSFTVFILAFLQLFSDAIFNFQVHIKWYTKRQKIPIYFSASFLAILTQILEINHNFNINIILTNIY